MLLKISNWVFKGDLIQNNNSDFVRFFEGSVVYCDNDRSLKYFLFVSILNNIYFFIF